MTGSSILDTIEAMPRRERKVIDWDAVAPEPTPSVEALAYSEPHPSGLPWHVIEAHEASKARLHQHGSATAEITFKPEIGAFELVTESRGVMDILRGLGAGAKITIHF